MNIQLEFTVEKINLIMIALSKMPYEMVFSLIQEINEQVKPQLNNTNTVGPPPN